MITLEQLKQLERDGHWSEIRRLAPVLLSRFSGAELARVHLATSKAFEVTATGTADYREALRHTRGALRAAEPGSLLHTWALHREAAYLADFGDFKGAEKAALAFLEALPRHPQARQVAPWVFWALGRVRSRQGRHSEAVALLRQALAVGMGGECAERIQLTLVRFHARAGQIGQALEALPSNLVHVPAGKRHAALALICAAAGDWSGAQREAKLALRSYATGEWRVYDVVEAAELLLTLKAAAQVLGQPGQAAVWLVHTAALLSRWNAGVMITLLSTLRVEGGARHNAAASHRGPAGHKRTGLRGTVG